MILCKEIVAKICWQLYARFMKHASNSRSGSARPNTTLLLDPRNLRGLAHPLRVRIRAALSEHGPATATQLAVRLSLSSGATSYHLRQLAQYGFVVEEPDQGHGRERYWRVTHAVVEYDSSTGAENPDLGGVYLRAVAQLYADRIVRFVDEVGDAPAVLGTEWVRAWTISHWNLHLSAVEASALKEHLVDLLQGYTQRPVEAGTRQVTVQLQLLPARPDTDA